MEKGNYKEVWTVTERDGRSFWSRSGIAFPNRDGSMNLHLDTLPLSGKLQIRDPKPKDEHAPGFDFPRHQAEAA